MVQGGVFDRGLQALEQLGLSDVLLPFLLIFTVVFAVLEKSKILGEDSRRFNVIIALIMGLAVVIPHSLGIYPQGVDAVTIINTALPNVSVVIIAVIMLLILIGVFGFELQGGGAVSGIVGILAFLIVVYIFGSAAQWWIIPDMLWWLSDPDTQALIVVILVFGIIVWFITGEKKTQAEGFIDKIGKFLTRKGGGGH